MKKTFLFTALLLLINCILFAQTDATGETELYERLKSVDKELNLVYKNTMQKITISNRKNLKKEQKNWIKQRDLKCNNNNENGVYGNKLRIDCLIQETINRTNQIKKWKKE